jgi:multidrug efflux pump subunit AcrA (membrane-fusion protein)
VHAGQPVTVRLNAYPDVALAAQVLAVIPTADRSTATVKVRIGLTQRDARVLPDMGARVSFESSAGEVALNAG